ncbi:MAG: hypothetical protein KVP17_000086 [Porospora cf. gigantea B]|uniref:uncharacterized protein n=1 Tax=Porospora cf. gigantea B TaxID=2853592 RepID=UPI003571B9AA|nr:MAG: hypothetical protein KVP17_000086 [Porospora cf. gigantea B]
MALVLALDQGTTSSRTVLLRGASVVCKVQKPLTPLYPEPGWVEQDPLEIWATQSSTIAECVALSGIDSGLIQAIGIANQRETVVVWDRLTGEPVYNAIVWQCRRTSNECLLLKRAGLEPVVRQKTGLLLDPYFSATKVCWILDHVEGARLRAERGELLMGTIDTWLLWKLTDGGEHLTDFTNASRTSLFNIDTLDWDLELLRIFRVPRCMLPDVRSSASTFCEVNLGGRSRAVPVSCMVGDQQAALYAHGCVSPGLAKSTFGTGCFLLAHTGSLRVDSRDGLLTTIACDSEGSPSYALEGSVFIAGAAIQWLTEELGILKTASESEALARSVDDSGGICVVPAFAGLGAPHWKPLARGAVFGVNQNTTKAHIVRAVLESIALQTYDIVETMQRELPLCSLSVDGGVTSNDLLLEILSDTLGLPVARPAIQEMTALGAGMMAALRVEAIDRQTLDIQEFHPSEKEDTRVARQKRWKRGLRALYTWTES